MTYARRETDFPPIESVSFMGRVGRAFLYVQRCFDVARERRQLLSLDDEALKDIGISRADAVREAGRSFWDIDERKS